MGQVLVAPMNKAFFVSGPRGVRMVVGGCVFKLAVVETLEEMDLSLLTMEVQSREVESAKGVPVSVHGVFQVKVDAFRDTDANSLVVNEEQLKKASQTCLGKTEEEIRDQLLSTLEGHQRSIVGALSVEELYRDRASLQRQIKEQVETDMRQFGMKLVSYTITKLEDSQGYLEALGQTQMARVMRDAELGRSQHEEAARRTISEVESQAEVEVARAQRSAHVAMSGAQGNVAESDRNLQMLRSSLEKEVGHARAEAEAAGRIAEAQQSRLRVREETQQQVERANLMVKVTEFQSEIAKIQKTGTSNANLIAQRLEAEGVKVESAVLAEQRRLLGVAEAVAVGAKGTAQAAIMRARAQAFKLFGDAAITESLIKTMPEIAQQLCAPLSRTERMVFVMWDTTSASNVVREVNTLLKSVPTAMHDAVGINMQERLASVYAGRPKGHTSAVVRTPRHPGPAAPRAGGDAPVLVRQEDSVPALPLASGGPSSMSSGSARAWAWMGGSDSMPPVMEGSHTPHVQAVERKDSRRLSAAQWLENASVFSSLHDFDVPEYDAPSPPRPTAMDLGDEGEGESESEGEGDGNEGGSSEGGEGEGEGEKGSR